MSSCAKHVILSASEGSAPSETRGSLPGAPSLTLPGLVSKRRTRTSLRSCGILRFAQDDMVGRDDMAGQDAMVGQDDMDNAHEDRARRRMGARGETQFPLTRRGRASPLHVTQPGTGVRCPATRTGDINTGPKRNPGVGRHQGGPSGGTTHAGPRSDHRRGISVPRTGHPPQWGGILCGRPRTHTTRPTCPYPLQRIRHPRTNDELLRE